MRRIWIILASALPLAALNAQASAQGQCPELTRLRSEAAEALSKARDAKKDRCEAQTRYLLAWEDIVRYANDHRGSCDIPVASMKEIDTRHREAIEGRDDACGGRRRFPPDVRPHW